MNASTAGFAVPARRARHGFVARSAVLMGLAFGLAPAVLADEAVPGISEGFRFGEQDGEALYRAICQGCHMPDGKGAQGAGAYPALAGNPKLAAGRYPAYTVLQGRKGMPAFKNALTDQQVAEVTNYVRTHLGNSYPDAISAADVKSMR